MYLHKTKNGHYTPPCCYFSGELEVVECLPQTFSGGMMVYGGVKSSCKMKEKHDGFLYPHVNKKDCIGCGLCIKKCPEYSFIAREQLDLVCLESIAGVWNFQTEYFEI